MSDHMHPMRLEPFFDEILRTKGAVLAGTHPAPTREELEAEFKTAVLRAAVALFGDATPLEVVFDPAMGVVVLQVVVVRETPTDPHREVALQAVAQEFPDAQVGDELLITIEYDPTTMSKESDAEANARMAGVLPLPVRSRALGPLLTRELNTALQRYFPPPRFPDDSMGALLASSGGWMRGLSVRSGEFELELGRAFFDFFWHDLNLGWFEYGFETVYRCGGVEVFRGAGRQSSVTLKDGSLFLAPLSRGDNEGVVRSWAELPTHVDARAQVLEVLAKVAEPLARGESPNAPVALEAVLGAALRPPRPDGLWRWLEATLPRLLVGHRHQLTIAGAPWTFEVRKAWPPFHGHPGFGGATVEVVASAGPDRLDATAPIGAGHLEASALALRGPATEEERRDLEAIAARYLGWIDAGLAHRAAQGRLDELGEWDSFHAVDGHFPLVELLAQRLDWGPPGEPPVPAFDDPALDRAAKALATVEGEALEELRQTLDGPDVLAAFTVQGWTVVLLDELANHPWGSHCGLALVPPEGGARVSVMVVDAWNPEARMVIDGDAFAFRRCIEWLRGGITRGDHDVTLTFQPPPEDDEEQAELVELALTDWLRFDLPDLDDRFLVDWRAQWHVVNAVSKVEDFAGIYGFSPTSLEKLRARDLPLWRRFLREVVDPRFVATTGEKLLAARPV
jgi:hypothetical protein